MSIIHGYRIGNKRIGIVSKMFLVCTELKKKIVFGSTLLPLDNKEDNINKKEALKADIRTNER